MLRYHNVHYAINTKTARAQDDTKHSSSSRASKQEFCIWRVAALILSPGDDDDVVALNTNPFFASLRRPWMKITKKEFCPLENWTRKLSNSLAAKSWHLLGNFFQPFFSYLAAAGFLGGFSQNKLRCVSWKGPRRKTWKEEQKKQHPTLVLGSIGRKHNARWQHRRKIGDFIRLNFFVANQNTAGYIRQKCSNIQSDGAIPNRCMLYWCFSAILQLKLGKKLLPGSYPTPSIVLSFMNQCAYWLGK